MVSQVSRSRELERTRMSAVHSPTWYSLSRLRGTFGQSAGEFYCGDGFLLALLIGAAPIGVVMTAVLTDISMPPSKPSDWYLIALLLLIATAAWFLVPRAGRSVEIDAEAITVRSRTGRVLARVLLPDLEDARVDLYHGEGSSSKTLVLVTSHKSHYVPLPAALEREL